MTTVVGLRGATPAGIAEPCEEVVDMLRNLLARAESGGLKGLAVAWVDVANSLHTKWDGNADSHCLLAAVQILQYRLVSSVVDGD